MAINLPPPSDWLKLPACFLLTSGVKVMVESFAEAEREPALRDRAYEYIGMTSATQGTSVRHLYKELGDPHVH